MDQKGSVLTKSDRDDIDIDHFNKLHRKDLTLEEILSLETDQDVRKIIQQIIFFFYFPLFIVLAYFSKAVRGCKAGANIQR